MITDTSGAERTILRVASVAVLLFVVLFWQLGTPTFWDPDEAHYAETSRELLRTGDWLAPYYNEQPFFDKPILFHWLQAGAMAIVGPTELGARLPAALGALALVATTAWLGATLVSFEVGFMAALLLAANPAVFALARYAILDAVFTAFLFGGVSLIAVAALADRPRLQWSGYILLALAVLTKGPVALILSGLAFLLAVAVSAELRPRLLALRFVAGLAIVAVIAGPWFVYMWLRFRGAFVSGYLLDENVRLFATNRFGSKFDAGFYFRVLGAGLLPWTGLLVGRLVDDARTAIRERRLDAIDTLLWCWTFTVVGFFTLSTFKLDHYVFPAAPALSLLIARAWADVRAARPGVGGRLTTGSRIGLRTIGPVLAVIGAGGGYFMIARLSLPLGAMIVPTVVLAAGAFITFRESFGKPTLPRMPWAALAACLVTYAGVIVWALPALEAHKVVPDVARWVADHAPPGQRVGLYRLNRWSTSFRFYLDRHALPFDGIEEARAFLSATEPFYCAMIGPSYDELAAEGLPLQVVYEREGMWATSGRVLWRRPAPPTRFLVVGRRGDVVSRKIEP